MNSADEVVAAAIEETVSGRRAPGQRVVTFGEALVRLVAPGQERLERAASFGISVGGPEVNTAVALAALGAPAIWVSSLPESPPGWLILRHVRATGVDVSHVKMVPARPARVGLAFVENGPDPRPPVVHQDAEGTAMALLRPGTFDWPRLLEGAAVFHLSGITLGLSAGVRAEALEAIRTANQLGVPVSFDLRHDAGAWSEATARQVFVQVIPAVDLLFASRGTLRTFFGIEGSYESVLRQAIQKLGVAAATVSRRRSRGSRRLTLESMAMGKSGALVESGSRNIEVVDRHGAGDAFVAGFLVGYLENPLGLARAVSLGAAASALAYTMPGEFLCTSRDEVEALAKGGE